MDTTKKIIGVISYTEVLDCIDELRDAVKRNDVQLYNIAASLFNAHKERAIRETKHNELLINRVAIEIEEEAKKAGFFPPPPPPEPEKKEEAKPEAEAPKPAENDSCPEAKEEAKDEQPSAEETRQD